MNLDDVAEELSDALRTISGLRVPPWGVEQLNPPAALVLLPETITYDETKRRGFDRFSDWVILLALARGNAEFTRRDLAAYCDGSGSKSVKAAVDGFAYTSCDTVRVTSAEPRVWTMRTVSYDGVMFHVDITGRGTA